MYQYPDREKLITGLSYIGNEANSVLIGPSQYEKSTMEDCIQSFLLYFDAMIVIDDSTDGTTKILEKYCTTIVPIGDRPFDTGALRNELISMLQTPWGWFFFPDEKVETTLTADQVRYIVSTRHPLIYALSLRRWNVMGELEAQGYQYPDYQPVIVRSTVQYTLGWHEHLTRPSYFVGEDIPLRIIHLLRQSDGKRRAHNRWRSFDKWHKQGYWTPNYDDGDF